VSTTAIKRAVYGKLSGDTTLTNLLGTPAAGFTKSIYYQVAPESAAFPYVLFAKQSGVPTEAFGAHTLADTSPSFAHDTDIWLIKGVDRSTSADTAEAIDLRIQALLNDGTLSISGGALLYLRRQSDVDYGEVSDGVQYHHSGSLYRLVWT
jgi:hypothetical protein